MTLDLLESHRVLTLFLFVALDICYQPGPEWDMWLSSLSDWPGVDSLLSCWT